VDKLIDSGLEVQSRCYESYRQAAEAEQCTWLVDDHQVFDFGNTQLQILTGADTWSDINDYSVVARLNCGEVEFLFMGDAETEAEACLQGDIGAEILKVGHHGSDSSTSSEFLNRVKPQVAIISVGADNDYSHPAPATLPRLQNIGAHIYRTDLNRNVIVSTYGNTYSVLTDKNGRQHQPD